MNKRIILYGALIILLLFPIVLWLLPSTLFDDSSIIICPSRLFFGIECLGCGMTRAIMHLHHFELEDAIYYNLGSILIYPCLIVIWFRWALRLFKGIKTINKIPVDTL